MVTKVLSVEEARILFLFQFFLLPCLSFYVMFFSLFRVFLRAFRRKVGFDVCLMHYKKSFLKVLDLRT